MENRAKSWFNNYYYRLLCIEFTIGLLSVRGRWQWWCGMNFVFSLVFLLFFLSEFSVSILHFYEFFTCYHFSLTHFDDFPLVCWGGCCWMESFLGWYCFSSTAFTGFGFVIVSLVRSFIPFSSFFLSFTLVFIRGNLSLWLFLLLLTVISLNPFGWMRHLIVQSSRKKRMCGSKTLMGMHQDGDRGSTDRNRNRELRMNQEVYNWTRWAFFLIK